MKYLGLSEQSALELNTLRSLTVTIDKNIDKNIEVLRSQKNHQFNLVNWKDLRESVRMMELKSKLKEFQNIQIDGEDLVNLENLDGPGGGVGRLK